MRHSMSPWDAQRTDANYAYDCARNVVHENTHHQLRLIVDPLLFRLLPPGGILILYWDCNASGERIHCDKEREGRTRRQDSSSYLR
jgi:hypothetical protein